MYVNILLLNLLYFNPIYLLYSINTISSLVCTTYRDIDSLFYIEEFVYLHGFINWLIIFAISRSKIKYSWTIKKIISGRLIYITISMYKTLT